jgi:predicted RNA-binding protein associated with RNAse of E/G family
VTPLPEVHIHYRRPPDREDVFVQHLVLDAPEVKVTFQPATPIHSPVILEGRPVLEPGSPVVWFTFPGLWHDIGRFHTEDGRYTGLYANVLTPCRLHPPCGPSPLRWDTTDLFLDLWWGAGGTPRLVDEADLDEARDRGWVTPVVAARAHREGRRLLREAGESWPPEVVREWTLQRARSALGTGEAQSSSPRTRWAEQSRE